MGAASSRHPKRSVWHQVRRHVWVHWATVVSLTTSTGRVLTKASNADGCASIGRLKDVTFKIEVTSEGFKAVTEQVTLPAIQVAAQAAVDLECVTDCR